MRLGDDIDDHCSRCKRTMDHSVVSMVGEEVVKVRCRTCNSEHKFHHNKTGKKEMTAKEAFDKLIASMPGAQSEPPEAGKTERKKKKQQPS
jgi:recombinational DNA repair protein (RecF pathway)